MPLGVPGQNYQAPQGAVANYGNLQGNTNLNDYVNQYNQFMQARGNANTWQYQPQAINAAAPVQEQNRWEGPSRDMSSVDRFFAEASRFAEGLAGATGFQGFNEDESALSTLGRFALQLPLGMASAPFSGAASLYEGFTGRPVTEANLETNQMSAQDLTGFQQAGAIGTGLVDTLGLFVGGSAEGINAISNAGRTLLGRPTKQALGVTGRKLFGEGGGAILADTIEEAGEEAFQSVMEDIRADQLDEGTFGRAVEGAGWGALGGAMMSGGGQAANRVMGAEGPKANVNIDESNIGQRVETEWGRNFNTRITGNTLTPGAISHANEFMSQDNEVAGGVNGVQVTSSNALNLTEAEVGQQLLLGVTHSDVEGSLDALAALFDNVIASYSNRTDGLNAVKRELTNIASNRNIQARTDAYNDLIKRNGGIVVKINRTPNSNDGEISDFRVTKVNNGAGISLHPLAWTVYGSDVDGDRMTIFFNRDQDSQGFITANLMSANGEKINYSEDYASFLTDNTDMQDIAKEIFNESVDIAFANQPEIARQLKQDLKDAYDMKTHPKKAHRNILVTNALNNFRSSYITSRAAEGEVTPALELEADNALSNVMTGMVRGVSTSNYALEDAADRYQQLLESGVKDAVVNSGFISAAELEGAGNLGSSNAVEALINWGIRIAQTTTLTNPFYRQFPQIYAGTQERSGMVQGGTFTNAERVFESLFANCFRLVDVSFDVETAIESVFQIAIQDRVTARLNNRRLGSNGAISLDDFLNIYVEERNEVAKQFNNAWTAANSRTNHARMPGAPRPKSENLSASQNIKEIGREFIDIFGAYNVTDIFAAGSEYDNVRIIDIVSEDADTGQVISRFGLGNDVERFWRTIVSEYNGRSYATAKRIENMLSSYSEDLIKWLNNGEILLDNSGNIILDAASREKLIWITQAFQEIFGYDTAYELGVHSVEGFINSSWGKSLMRGDLDTAINAVISIKLTSVYSEVFEVLDDFYSDDATKREKARQIIGYRLAENQGISLLHNEIYDQFTNQGESLELLTYFTNLSIDFSEKNERFNLISELDSRENALLDYAIRTSDSKVEMSKISQSLRRSEGAWRNAAVQMGEAISRQIDQLDRALSNKAPLGNGDTVVTYEDLFEFVSYYGDNYMTDFSSDVLGTIAMEAGRLAKESINKGAVKDASAALYLENTIAIYGEQIASLDVVPISIGVLSRDNLRANRSAIVKALTDPSVDFEVWDPSSDQRWHVTHEGLYKSFGIDLKDGKATGIELMQLIRKCPQLATYIVPQTFNVMYSGSDASVVQVMDRMPVEAITHFMNMKKDQSPKRKIEQSRAFIRSKIISNPKMVALAIAADENFGKYSSEKDARISMEKTMERLINEVMSRCYTLSGSFNQDSAVDTMQAQDDAKIIRTMQDILGNISALSEIEAEADLTAEILSNTRRTMFKEWLYDGLGLKKDVIDNDVDPSSFEAAKKRRYVINVLLNQVTKEGAYARYFNQLNDNRDILVEIADEALASKDKGIVEATKNFDNAGDLVNAIFGDETYISTMASALDPEDTLHIVTDEDISNAFESANGYKNLLQKFRAVTEKRASDFTWDDVVKQLGEDPELDTLTRLASTMNHVSLIYELNEMNKTQFAAVNVMAGYQEAMARESLREFSESVYKEMSDAKLEAYKTVSDLDFHFDDPVHGYGYTDSLFDLGGGGIPSYISNNAQKTKFFAAAGLIGQIDCGHVGEGNEVTSLDVRRNFQDYIGKKYTNLDTGEEGYFSSITNLPPSDQRLVVRDVKQCLCAACTLHARKANSNAYSTQFGDIMRHLVNHTMEPLALQLKKFVGDKDCIYRPMTGDAYKPALVSVGDGDLRTQLLKIRQDATNSVAKVYETLFAKEDYAKLNFGEDESYSIASFVTPYIKLVLQINGRSMTIPIPALSLANEEQFASVKSAIDPLIDNGATIEGVMPVVMSIDEACSHILRNVDREYYTLFAQGGMTEDDNISKKAAEWAEQSLRNFGSYAEYANVADLFSSLPYRQYTNNMGMFPTNTSTPMMNWFGIDLDEKFTGRSYERYRTRTINELSSKQRGTLEEQIRAIEQDAFDNNLNGYLLSYSQVYDIAQNIGDIAEGPTRISVRNFSRSLSNPEMGNINQSMYTSEDGKTYKLAEFYFGDGTGVRSAFKHAFKNNHAFILPANLISHALPDSQVNTPLWKKIREDALDHTVTIDGETFHVIDPFDELSRTGIGRQHGVSSFVSVADSGRKYKTLIAIDDPSIIGDSAVIWNPADDDSRRFYGSHDFGNIENYFGTSRIGAYGIATESNIKNLSNMLNSAESIDSLPIDWSIVSYMREQGTRKQESVYKSAVESFISNGGTNDGSVCDGDCIGLIRMDSPLGATYAPIFYEGSGLPVMADKVSELGFDNGKVNGIVDASDIDLTKISIKWMFRDFAYKCVGKDIAPEEFASLPKLDSAAFGKKIDGMPDGYIDLNSAQGRFGGNNLRQLGVLLHNFTQDNGGNLFFNIDGGAITAKPELHPNMNISTILELQSGKNSLRWESFVRNEFKIFSTEYDYMNEIVRTWAKRMYVLSGNSWERVANFFCPELVYVDGLNRADGTIEAVKNEEVADRSLGDLSSLYKSAGIKAVDKNLDMIFNGVSKDDILGLYNILTNGVCPPSVDAGLSNNDWLIDANGMMRLADGTRARVIIELPIADSGHSEFFTSVSYSGNLSFQAVSKRIMADGHIMGDPDVAMSRLASVVGDYEHMVKNKKQKWKENVLDGILPEPQINDELAKRADLRRNEPIVTARWRQYRQECLKYRQEFIDSISIVKEYGSNENAFDDREFSNRMHDKLTKINAELGYKVGDMGAVSMSELISYVKQDFGFSKNKGKGFGELTATQFERSVDRIAKSLKETGFLIDVGKHGYYTGARGDIRVPMGILDRNVAIRIYNAPNIKGKLQAQGINSLDEYIAKMIDDCRNTTMEVITSIDDRAKRLALWKMVDALGYANGVDTISGNILGHTYMADLMAEAKRFGTSLSGYDARLAEQYDEFCQLSTDYFEKIEHAAFDRSHFTHDDENAWGGRRVYARGTDDSIVDATLRNLATARRAMGIANVMMLPANVTERAVNQGLQSIALKLGRSGVGVYASDFQWNDYQNVINASKSEELVKVYAALRTAELLGIDREFLAMARDSGDFDAFVKEEFEKRNAFDRYTSMLMDFMSGGKFMIDGQIRNFIDRFAMEAAEKAQWWMMRDASGMTVLEQRIASDPAGWFIDVLNGTTTNSGADVLLARQCMNWAKRGDMAQRNLVSAIYTELARRSSKADFVTAAFISPYFQYATNRLGRVLQWVAPISTFHYIAVDAVTKGFASDWDFFGTGLKFSDLALEDVQMQSNIREAITLDIMHLGPQLVALMLLGMGAFEPPEDDDKWGNFKEWTFCGLRIDANWWIEDVLGLAIPYACFGASVREGRPRMDLLVNGLAYYLANNPVTKVSDAIEALFDPFAELSQWYDDDVEGFAKAMGGPPSPSDMIMGRATSFGLSFASQFITPGFVRELYNAGREWETSYKRIYKTSATGDLVPDAEGNAQTQYTTYSDAMVRKMTRNNPVMGLLADLIYHPETGYMAHEMPRTVIYDPAQMNSIEHFSLYYDPFNKQEEKSDTEKDAIAIEVIATLQSNDVQTLARQGFALDYDTKQYVSKYIWDMIASLNDTWNNFQQSDYADFYVAGNGDYNEGRKLINNLKSEHYAMVNAWKTLYYDKLWSDEFTIAKYNRRFSRYAQDDNGNFYATGMNNQPFFLPIALGSGESPEGSWQFNMGRENDWQTESVVTGDRTGERGLVPLQDELTKTPDISSWSSDGTDTGLSDRAANNGATPSSIFGAGTGADDGSGGTGTPGTRYTRSTRTGATPRGSRSSSPRRSGGSGGSGAPNIYSRINAPNISNPDTMRSTRMYDANYDALRPNFETKGSREAYKRSDI